MFGDWWHTDIGIAVAIAINIALIFISAVLTIHVLLHKSDPKASLMWIALVWFAPLFGACFYLLFGINRISRRAAKITQDIFVAGVDVIDVPDDLDLADDPWIEFRRLGNHITGSRRTQGNDVDIIEGVESVHQAMIEAINCSKKTIVMATYIFKRDDLGKALAEALVRADQRGVDVKVLLDGVGNGFGRSRIYRKLKDGGVEVHRFLHSIWPWRMPFLNLRNHRKILIVDSAIGFIGSLNIGYVSNLETHFRVRGPVLSQMLTAFDFDWRLAGGTALPLGFKGPSIKKAGKTVSRVIPSGPLYPRERLRWILLGAMGAATKNIKIVTPYFIPDQGLLSGLIMAALRGVKVEIILPKHSNYPFADWAGRRQLQELLRVGCHIYLREDIFDHSKLMSIDGHWALLGSSNWDARSLRLNFELDLECEDNALVSELDVLIEDRKLQSERLLWETYQARSIFSKLRDSAARLLLPYL